MRFVGADVPEEFGGLGLDKISSAIITEKFSRAGSFSLSMAPMSALDLCQCCSETKRKETYLPGLASGRTIAAYALTEPGSGSDALGAKTTAVLNEAGTHYVLNRGKNSGSQTPHLPTSLSVIRKLMSEHFSAFIVEKDFPGVKTGPEEKKMGIKGSSTRTLILEDAQVPKENLLGEAGRGHVIAFNILNIGRYKLAVGTVGASKRVIQLSAEYANQRK
ncbi:acyl-CoA dehydrogenase family protein [Bacillus sp. SL00103]